MANIGKTIQKYFYKVRDWYDPEIVFVSKPLQKTDGGNCFYPVYEFSVHYIDKTVPVVVDSMDPSSWTGGTPESKIQDLYKYYIKKMQKQHQNRSR